MFMSLNQGIVVQYINFSLTIIETVRSKLYKAFNVTRLYPCHLPTGQAALISCSIFATQSMVEVVFFDFSNILSYNTKAFRHFPIPIIGTIVLILAEDNVNSPSYLHNPEMQYHIAKLLKGNIETFKKVFVLIISNLADDVPQGFLSQEWWMHFGLDDFVPDSSILQVLDIKANHWEIVEQNLSVLNTFFSLHPNTASVLTGAIDFAYPYLGLGLEAPLGFIECLMRVLLSQGKAHTIWIDAIPTPHVLSGDTGQIIDHRLHDRYFLYYDDFIIAEPIVIELKPYELSYFDPNCCDLISAHHVYLEVEGFVYDSMFALGKPIPIREYQGRLKSSWRKNVEVKPTISWLENKLNLDDLLEAARKSRI